MRGPNSAPLAEIQSNNTRHIGSAITEAWTDSVKVGGAALAMCDGNTNRTVGFFEH